MKIIITGASGFVGRNLTRLFLENNFNVLPLSLRKENWQLPTNASALIHLAGIEKDTNSTSNQDEYFQVNSYLTEKIFKQFLQSDIRDFIFISSIKASADSSNSILDETSTPNPTSSYGKSKLLAENLLSKYDLNDNKRLIILRPCLIHGPEDTGNLRLLFKIAEKGIPYPFGSFKNLRSYIGVENLSFIIKEILKNTNVKSGIYHVADDESLSTNKLIKVMYQNLGKKPRILNLPVFPIKLISKIFSSLGVKFIEEKLTKLTESFVVSNSKIKKELGISYLPFSAEEGLQKTLESFKN